MAAQTRPAALRQGCRPALQHAEEFPMTTPTTSAVAPLADGEFALHDLRVRVVEVGARCTCSMRVGDLVELRGGKLSIPGDRSFCLYALQAVIPLLPAKQRMNHPADWMETDGTCTCPDPACKLLMQIERTRVSTFRHDEVSAQVAWEDVRSARPAP
jgi:uncharacterized repeat protein (TIGR04076 family)